MLSDLDIIDICAALYEDQKPGYWTHEFPIDGSWCAVKRVDDVDVVVWRGSTTVRDWVEDFIASPAIDFEDIKLGACHAGFLAGVRGVLPEVNAVLGPNVIVTGHSLGAGHAFIHAGYLVTGAKLAAPIVPQRIVVFGAPRPGFGTLKTLLAGVPIRSYKNGDDPVTDVPVTIPPALEYVEPAPFIALNEAVTANDPWGPLGAHHITLYRSGIAKLFPVPGLAPAA